MSSSTLRLITTRADEIAAVVLNPLQGVLRAAVGHGGGGGTSAHPPSGTGASSEFGEWLRRLRATCTASRVPLIFDESATGFRLALGGAQEYFGVSADVVCYGKTLGGGLPVGVVCGASWLMEDSEPHLPLRAGTGGSARGGMACNAGLMRRTRRFLDEVSCALISPRCRHARRFGCVGLGHSAKLVSALLAAPARHPSRPPSKLQWRP